MTYHYRMTEQSARAQARCMYPWRGDDLVLTIQGCVCREVKDKLQVSEMSDRISFKMVAKFGTSLNMGEKLMQGPTIKVC